MTKDGTIKGKLIVGKTLKVKEPDHQPGRRPR